MVQVVAEVVVGVVEKDHEPRKRTEVANPMERGVAKRRMARVEGERVRMAKEKRKGLARMASLAMGSLDLHWPVTFLGVIANFMALCEAGACSVRRRCAGGGPIARNGDSCAQVVRY